jgi:hypothetical protein
LDKVSAKAKKVSAKNEIFLFREARGMVRPFINTHQAENPYQSPYRTE